MTDPRGKISKIEFDWVLAHMKKHNLAADAVTIEIWSTDGKDRHVAIRTKGGKLIEVTPKAENDPTQPS